MKGGTPITEIIFELQQEQARVAELLEKLSACLAPKTIKAAEPTPIIESADYPLATDSQAAMLYAIVSKHGVPNNVWEPVVMSYTTDGTAWTGSVPKAYVNSLRKELIELAIQSNPKFPLEKFTASGDPNPEWIKTAI
jgi:hypothetical protein